jgi:hypothetical protein
MRSPIGNELDEKEEHKRAEQTPLEEPHRARRGPAVMLISSPRNMSYLLSTLDEWSGFNASLRDAQRRRVPVCETNDRVGA